jgi:hypothetical protein
MFIGNAITLAEPVQVFGPTGPTDSLVLDAVSSSFPASSVTWTQAHTTTGSNRHLTVFVQTLSVTDDLTGITYAGNAMTFVNKIANPHAAGWLYAYSIINPTVGTNNIVVSFATAKVGALSGISLTGANQTTQPSTSVTGSLAASLTFSLTTTTLTNFEDLIAFTVDSSGLSTAGANTTRTSAFASGSGQQLFISTASQTPIGSKTLNFANAVPATNWVGIMVSIRAL